MINAIHLFDVGRGWGEEGDKENITKGSYEQLVNAEAIREEQQQQQQQQRYRINNKITINDLRTRR